MSPPSPLSLAKTGDPIAIAALINQALQARGWMVRCDRQQEHLTLWVSGAILPPEEATVRYLRQGIAQLQIPGICELHIYGEQADRGVEGWRRTLVLVPPIPEGRHPPTAMVSPAIARAYQQLNVAPGSPLSIVEASYFKQKSVLLRQGDRADLAPLKAAYHQLRDHIQGQTAIAETVPADGEISAELTNPNNPSSIALAQLPLLLQQRGFNAQVVIRPPQLQIQLPVTGAVSSRRALAQIYTLLAEQDLAALGIQNLRFLVVCGVTSSKTIVWKRRVPLPRQDALSPDNTDLFSFQNRTSNTYIFPALLLLGIVMNALSLVNFLLFGIKIWFHEFGHATVAWLAGRRAIPLPFGWTAVAPERSLFVYLGLLILLALLFGFGRQEQKRWPMILAGGLMGLQFAMTWLLPTTTFDMLLAFGGIGGEFYLCTLLMIGFYFPLPHYFRWDFYRYPVVLGAAFCFWGQFWLWKQIERGRASIPWGAIWGDPDHGDMNQLANIHFWSPRQIMDTYNAIGNLCLIAILGVYLYFFWKHNRPMLFALSQRWIARF